MSLNFHRNRARQMLLLRFTNEIASERGAACLKRHRGIGGEAGTKTYKHLSQNSVKVNLKTSPGMEVEEGIKGNKW